MSTRWHFNRSKRFLEDERDCVRSIDRDTPSRISQIQQHQPSPPITVCRDRDFIRTVPFDWLTRHLVGKERHRP
jgi:hypothetical protein